MKAIWYNGKSIGDFIHSFIPSSSFILKMLIDYPVPGKLLLLDSPGGQQAFNMESSKHTYKGIKYYEGKWEGDLI